MYTKFTAVLAGIVISTFAALAIFLPSNAEREPSDGAAPALANSPSLLDADIASAFVQLPIHFELAQKPGTAYARGPGYQILLAPDSTTFLLQNGQHRSQLVMNLVGSRAVPVLAESPMTGVSNYLLGNESSHWRLGVKHYARVRQRDVYPGIDLIHYGRDRQLEYDFIVAPGADPNAIRIAYADAASLRVDADGDLHIAVPNGTVTHRRPVLYQVLDHGARKLIDGAFRLIRNASGRVIEVAFDIGDYDRRRVLVIDPVLSYATFLGGTSGNEQVNDIAVDSVGALYVTGTTGATNFPVTGGSLQTTLGGSADVFVAKLNPTGTALEYSTYIGGSNADSSYAIRLAAGTAYVAGETSSNNFPTAGAPAQASFGGVRDAFVLRLNATGTALLYSTYLGGSAGEPASLGTTSFEIDADGNAYLSGVTESINYPVTSGAPQPARGNPNVAQSDSDMFLSKLNSTGTTLLFSSYHGGSFLESSQFDSQLQPKQLAIDSSGNAWIVGATQSGDMPVTANAFDSSFNGTAGSNNDAFIVRFDTVAGTRSYSSYFGSTGNDRALGIALDSTGNVYFTGQAGANGFPTTAGAFDTSFNGGNADVFVAKINTASATLAYSTVLGGGAADQALHIRVDSAGNAFVAGEAGGGFPTTLGAFDSTINGSSDGFVTKLNATGSALLYSTFVGSSDSESVFAFTVDASGNAYGIAGNTTGDAQVTPGGRSFTGNFDEWFFKLNAAGTALLDASYLGGSDDDIASAIAVDALENFYIAGDTGSANFPATAGAVQTTKSSAGLAADTFVAKFSTTQGTPIAQPGALQFSAATYSVAENGGSATITISRAGGSSGAVAVQFATSNNTATAGSDYTATSGTLNWADGDSNPKTFVVAIADDNTVEGSETVNLVLSNPGGGASLGSPSTAVLTIADNDIAAPVVSLSASSLNFGNTNVGASSAAQSATLSNTGNASLVIATVTKSGANPTDFNLTADTCSGQTIAAGANCALTVTFAPTAAGVRAATLSIASNATGSPNLLALSGTGVAPQLQAGTLQFSAAAYSGNENGGPITITLTRTNGADGAVSVAIASGGGSASAGFDYTSLSTTVTWATGDTASKTVTLAILDDASDEPDESVTIALSSPAGGAVLGSPSSATVTILDNDAPPTQNVIVEGRYGGGGGSVGAVDLLALTILLMAAYLGHRKTRTRGAFVMCLVGAIAGPSKAADDFGWYLGAHAGQVRSTLSAGDIARGLAGRGIIATVNAKRERFGASLELGYQFERGAHLSAALLNLGEYAVTVSASTANTQQLLNDTADLLGNGGRGLRLAAGWRFAVGSHWSLTPRIGGVWWDSDTEVAIGANSLRRTNDDLDFFAGVEVSRQFTRTAAALRLERYAVGARNDIDVVTLGFSYRLRR